MKIESGNLNQIFCHYTSAQLQLINIDVTFLRQDLIGT